MRFRPDSRRKCKTNISLEACEPRSLMASNAFAVVEGVIPQGERSAEVRIRVDPNDFTKARHGLSFVVTATGENGQKLAIGRFEGISGSRTTGQRRTGFGATVVKLVEGEYRFVVRANAWSGSEFRVEFAMAGDVDGDGSVGSSDVVTLRQSYGAIVGMARYVAAADINGSGGIGHADWAMLRGNFGNSTRLTPLETDVEFDRLHETSRLVALRASGLPGTEVMVRDSDGNSMTGVIDATGQANFHILVEPGHSLLDMTSTDRFGQRVFSSHAVTRAATSDYLGVGFEPYVKQWIEGSNPPATPPWNSYATGNASVANQIALVGSHFASLATYSTGYAGYYPNGTPWNQVDSNWMVAPEAAAYNKTHDDLKIQVNQGIFQQTDPAGNLVAERMNIEIANAFSIAENANATYSGTVKRLIFTNEYVTDAARTSAVNALITANKAAAHAKGLEVGVRSQTFGQLTNPNSPYLAQMRQLIRNVDFIMLNIYPSDATKGIPTAIAELDAQYESIKKAATALNRKIEVLIGETGWPSQGLSFNDTTGASSTVANARDYFEAVKAWAESKKVETYLFEAIDEPWKSNRNAGPDTPVWQGPNGAEGHFGIWTYTTSDDSGTFVQKWSL